MPMLTAKTEKGQQRQLRKIEAEEDQFYMAVGKCIARWSYVDRSLFDLFRKALGIDRVRASMIYFRAVTLGPQLQLTNLIVTETFRYLRKDATVELAEEAEWDSIERDLEHNLIPVRNFLCHEHVQPTGHVHIVGNKEKGQFRVKTAEHWTQIMERSHKPPRKDKRAPLKMADLRAHRAALYAVEERLIKLSDRLAAMLQAKPFPPNS